MLLIATAVVSIKLNVDDIDGADGEDIVRVLDSSIFVDFLHFVDFFPGDGEHILDVVEVDIDEAVDEEDGRSFIVVGEEAIGSNHDEQGDYEDDREDDEDVAPPEPRGIR